MENSKGGLTHFPRVIPAGSVSKIDVRGKFIRIKEAPAPITLTIRGNALAGADGLAYTLEMKKFEKWRSDMEYDEIVIDNSEGADQIAVVITAGYGDYEAEIISRTQAAQTIANAVSAAQSIVISPSLATPTLVTIPENLTRKKLRISVVMTGVQQTAGSFPAVPVQVQPVLIDPDHFDGGSGFGNDGCYPMGAWRLLASGDVASGLYEMLVSDFTIETTSAVQVTLMNSGLCDASNTLTVGFRVFYCEEVYAAQ